MTKLVLPIVGAIAVALVVGLTLYSRFRSTEPGGEEGGGWLGPEEWPKTVEEAVTTLHDVLTRRQKRRLRSMKRDELFELHFTLGQWIRNSFGLWRGNEELLEDAGTFHPDDASMVIIEKLWESLQEEP